MKVGDIVEVLEPFNKAFPDQYSIDQIKEDGTIVIAGDRDFDSVWLRKV